MLVLFVCLLFVLLLGDSIAACLYEAEGEGNWEGLMRVGVLPSGFIIVGNIRGLTGVAGGLKKN